MPRAKRTRVGKPIEAVSKKIKSEDGTPTPVVAKSRSTAAGDSAATDQLRNRFKAVLQQHPTGISNTDLKEHFGADTYQKLVPIINDMRGSLEMSHVQNKGNSELYYRLLSAEVVSKFEGLDATSRMVYQVIEGVGNKGIWTKEIRMQTNVQQQALTKIFKSLESRRLIKPVKSVSAKSKKLYMLYDLQPSAELTGGVWYSDLEFDHEFINELRNFVLTAVRRMNNGNGVTLSDLRDKIVAANVSRVQLSIDELRQLVQTLVYDYLLDEVESPDGDVFYLKSRRVTSMCDFKWWECLDSDFGFREIQFEDGVTLAPHEPHYHTA